jgi:HEAT repeat protein
MGLLGKRALLVVGLCGLIGCKGGGESSPPAPSAESELAGSAGDANVGGVPGWELGERRRYGLELKSSATVEGKPLTAFELSGSWVVTAIEKGAERVKLYTALESGKMKSPIPELSSELSALEPELAVPFGVELGADGVAQVYIVSDQASGLVVGIRQLLVSALQVALRSGSTWQAQERDATGSYEAEYTLRPDGALSKRKLRYSSLQALQTAGKGDVLELMPKVLESQSLLRVTSRGVLESITSNERVASGGGQMMPIESVSALTLKSDAKQLLSAAEVTAVSAKLAGAQRVAPEALLRRSTNDGQFDEARIDGRTLDQVLAGLRALPPSGGEEKTGREEARGDLFAALTAMVRSQPETRKKVISLVRRGDPLAQTLVGALGAAGHPEAQKALAEVLAARKLSEAELRSAAIALSHTPKPEPEATAALIQLLDVRGLRIQALYGLGSQVNRLRAEGNEQRAKEVLSIVLDRLQRARDPVEHVTALRAVANAGHEDAFAAVEPLLSSTDGQVRAAAVESLQKMPLARADEVIARALSSDADVNVRRAAARAALRRAPTPELKAAARTAALSDTNPHVRLAALDIVKAYLPKAPELRAVLEASAEQDKEETIRRAAAAVLVGTSS